MNRIIQKFKELKRTKRQALITFITAGDPNLSATEKIVYELDKSGVDIVELGIPFSDPMADGPVIQAANERSLKKGTTLAKILKTVQKIRQKSEVPLLLMGYYNPILAYGIKKFAKDAAGVGVDAVLVVDLPPEESQDLKRELRKVGLPLIFLLAPTSDTVRIKKVAAEASGFVYCVSLTGVTGAKILWQKELRDMIRRIRRFIRIPLVVGFGVSTRRDVQTLSYADGVVVGSALIRQIEKGPASQILKRVSRYIARLHS